RLSAYPGAWVAPGSPFAEWPTLAVVDALLAPALAFGSRLFTFTPLRKQRKRLNMCRADYGEVPVIESGDALFTVSFSERDDSGVGAAEPQVSVRGDQIADPSPVSAGERFNMQSLVQDRLVEKDLSPGTQLALEQIGGFGDHHRSGDQWLRF